MTLALALLAVLTLPPLLAAPTSADTGRWWVSVRAAGPSGADSRHACGQEVTEAFSGGLRVQFQQVSMGDNPNELARAKLAQSARLLVAVGQPAPELLLGGPRAYRLRAGSRIRRPVRSGRTISSPVQVFRSLQNMRPQTRQILAVTANADIIASPMAARGAAQPGHGACRC